MYDTLIVGGGPAGLTAALHLAWHRRKVVVLDRRTGPLFFTLEELYNVPGMPEVKGIELQRRLRSQAEEMGAEVVRADIERAEGEEGEFTLSSEDGTSWVGKTLLLATGVARYHPTIDGDPRPCFKYAGKGNLYYCPDCEGPLLIGKSTVVIATATGNGGAGMALGLSRYTSDLRLLITPDATPLEANRRKRLEEKGIGIVEGELAELVGKRSQLTGLRLKDGTELEADAFFVSSPALGRTDLAQKLGVEMAATENHAQPKSQRGDTNIPGVWIAGDLRPMTQQVAVAMGTGNIAAVMIDQHLRRSDIRTDE